MYHTRTRFILLTLTLTLALLAACNRAAPPELAPQASGDCVTSGTTVTCTYTYTGNEQTFTVPSDVSSVGVVARGAPGGTGRLTVAGGQGGEVAATLAVTPDETLYLTVGGLPSAGDCYPDTSCIGGYNGGGNNGHYGGGGGGASDVRTASGDLSARVLVAAGGGGGGQGIYCGGGDDVPGGAGGNAGSSGGAGPACRGTASSGGGAGTQTEGGAGGAPHGQSGSLGQGGNGGHNSGGGGGGGLYGGGGGGTVSNDSFGPSSGAGGGGGGSNLVPAGGTARLNTTGVPQITITYTDVQADTTPPVITLTTPADGATYTLNQSVTVSYSCDDGDGSGVASCAGPVADGTAIDTSSVGTKTFKVTATDNQGNTAEKTAIYTVTYDFPGFSSPINNLPTLNTAKAGQSIPLKWHLTDANGAPVTNLSNVQVSVSSVGCSAGSGSDAIEEYVTSTSGLQNLGDGYYQYNWKSAKNYAGSCKTLLLNLGEGRSRTALFQFN